MSNLKSEKKANTKELFQHTFDMLKLLKAKTITPEEAKEHANLVKQANNLLKYELDREKAIRKYEDFNLREIEDH